MMKKTKWICHPQDGDENRLVPVFCKQFSVKPGLKEAKLSLSAHGLYEAQLNGQAVTDQKFTPGLTSYYHRIQVQTYDARIVPGRWTQAIAETEHTDAELIPQQGVPVREKKRFAGKLLRDSAGNYIFKTDWEA